MITKEKNSNRYHLIQAGWNFPGLDFVYYAENEVFIGEKSHSNV